MLCSSCKKNEAVYSKRFLESSMPNVIWLYCAKCAEENKPESLEIEPEVA